MSKKLRALIAAVGSVLWAGAQAGEAEEIRRQGTTLAASFVATFEWCAERNAEFANHSPADWLADDLRTEHHRRLLREILASQEYRVELSTWRKHLASADPREVESECRAIAERVLKPK